MTILKRLGLLTLIGLIPQYRAWNFNFDTFGNQEPVLLFDSGLGAYPVLIGLYDIEKGAKLENVILLDCEMHKQRTLENSLEMLPEFLPGYYYIECKTDPNRYQDHIKYLSCHGSALLSCKQNSLN